MVRIADAGAPPAHLTPVQEYRGEALTRTAVRALSALRRSEGALGEFAQRAHQTDCSIRERPPGMLFGEENSTLFSHGPDAVTPHQGTSSTSK